MIIENICKPNETQAKNVESVVEYYENQGFRIGENGEENLSSEIPIGGRTASGTELAVFPNPFNESIEIQINSTDQIQFDGQIIIEILDLTGKLVLIDVRSLSELKNGLEIDTQFLNAGFFYFHECRFYCS